MRSYELMYILDPTLDEDASSALVGKIEELMSKQGVQLEKTEPWGKRRLAYPIDGHWDGNYVLSYFDAPPGAISEMERRLRNTDGILRFLTVRLDEEQAKLARRKARREEKDKARKERRAARQSEAGGSGETAPTSAPPSASESPSASSSPSASPESEASSETSKPSEATE